jgi:hypothetical protein
MDTAARTTAATTTDFALASMDQPALSVCTLSVGKKWGLMLKIYYNLFLEEISMMFQ